MANITEGNFRYRDPTLVEIPTGSVINGGNFGQIIPNMVIMAGRELTINGGLFVNVKKDVNWIVNGGNFCQKDFCTHLHPSRVSFGLELCDENCRHVVDIDTVIIDGEVIHTTYTYKDIKV